MVFKVSSCSLQLNWKAMQNLAPFSCVAHLCHQFHGAQGPQVVRVSDLQEAQAYWIDLHHCGVFANSPLPRSLDPERRGPSVWHQVSSFPPAEGPGAKWAVSAVERLREACLSPLCVEFYLGKELSSLSLISTFSPFRIAFLFFFFKRMLKMELSNIAAIVLFFKHWIESESWMGYTLKVVSRTTLVSIVSWRKEMDLITTQGQSC